MAELIDGKLISSIIKDECKAKVEKLKSEGKEINYITSNKIIYF